MYKIAVAGTGCVGLLAVGLEYHSIGRQPTLSVGKKGVEEY